MIKILNKKDLETNATTPIEVGYYHLKFFKKDHHHMPGFRGIIHYRFDTEQDVLSSRVWNWYLTFNSDYLFVKNHCYILHIEPSSGGFGKHITKILYDTTEHKLINE